MTSIVPRQTVETARASGVVSGSMARARMSRLMRVSMVSRKVLSFMGLGWLRLLPADDAINQIGVMSVFESLCVIACKAVI